LGHGVVAENWEKGEGGKTGLAFHSQGSARRTEVQEGSPKRCRKRKGREKKSIKAGVNTAESTTSIPEAEPQHRANRTRLLIVGMRREGSREKKEEQAVEEGRE